MAQPIIGNSNNQNPEGTSGVLGTSEIFNGIRGVTSAEGHGAVVGINDNHTQKAGPGVYGKSDGTGVWGDSKTWHGVAGFSESTTGGAGVYGKSKGAGILGEGETWHGVAGIYESATGGAGIYGKGKQFAGIFEGNVAITGQLTIKGLDIESLLRRIEQLEIKLRNNTTRVGTRRIICTNKMDPDSTPIPEGWIKVGRRNEDACIKQIGYDFNAFEIEYVGT